MKEVILEDRNPKTIVLSEVRESPCFIGILETIYKRKSFVLRHEYEKDLFTVFCLDDLLEGNRLLPNFTEINSWTLLCDDMERKIQNNHWEVFVFESHKELFKWLAE